MTDYINRVRVLKEFADIKAAGIRNRYGDAMYIDDAMKVIDTIPAADVREVKRGKWDDSFDGITPYCTVCKRTHNCLHRTPNFCPNCGADMRGEGGQNG